MRYPLILFVFLALIGSLPAQLNLSGKSKTYADSVAWAAKAFDKGQKLVQKGWKKDSKVLGTKAWEHLLKASYVLRKDGKFLKSAAQAHFLMGHYERAHQLLRMANKQGELLKPNDSIIVARSWHQMGAFDKAEKAYRAYLTNSSSDEPARRLAMAEKRSQQARFALQDPQLMVKARVDTFPLLPTQAEAWFPLISGDGLEAWFWFQNKKGKGQLWHTSVKEGHWHGEPLPFPEGFFPNALSADGHWLLLTGPGKGKSTDVYFAKREAHGWAQPVAFPKGINTPWNESHPSFDPLNQKLLFSSNRPGGKGGMDLFISNFDSKTGWGPAKPLPDHINTDGDELGGRFHFDGQTIYFASTGLPSIGGIDMYSAKLNDKSKPSHLGYPLNTPEDDVHLSLTANGQLALVPGLRDEFNDKKPIRMISLLGAGKKPLLMVADNASELSEEPRGMVLPNPENCVSCASVRWWTIELPRHQAGGRIEVWDALAAKHLHLIDFHALQTKQSLALPAGTIYFLVLFETQRLPRIFVVNHLRETGFHLIENTLPEDDSEGICLPLPSGSEEIPLAWLPVWKEVWKSYLEQFPSAYLEFFHHPDVDTKAFDWLFEQLHLQFPHAVLELRVSANQPENCLLVKSNSYEKGSQKNP